MTAMAQTRILSPRQREVLALAAAGHTNPEIAALLHITLHTVKTHMELVRGKLGATNRGHAVLLAAQAGEL